MGKSYHSKIKIKKMREKERKENNRQKLIILGRHHSKLQLCCIPLCVCVFFFFFVGNGCVDVYVGGASLRNLTTLCFCLEVI